MQKDNRLVYVILFGITALLLAWIILPTLSFAATLLNQEVVVETEADAKVEAKQEAGAATVAVEAKLEKKVEVSSPLKVSNVWAKPSLKGRTVGAAYLTLENTGEDTVSLVSAKSDVAGRVEIHTHIKSNGIMQMRKLSRLDVLPQDSQHFEPGGLHLMLFDLKQPLVKGERFTLTLKFSDGSTRTVNGAIRNPAAKQ